MTGEAVSRRVVAGALATLPFAGRVFAQGWSPSRPVQVVVPFAAGSGTDQVARLLQKVMEPIWPQRLVIENRPGANGAPAAAAVARAPADGHTLMVTTNTPHAANKALMKRLDYDPVSDFTPIIRLGNYVFWLVVGSHFPARSFAEFAAEVRRRPGQVTYASGNSTGIVGGATIARMLGVEMVHVPYRSTPPAIVDVVGGRVDAMVVDVAASRSQVEAGRLVPLGVTSRERSRLLPDLPSLHEQGLEGFDFVAWAGVVAPAGVPQPIRDAIHAAFARAWDTEAVRAQCAVLGFESFTSTPDEFGSFIAAEIVKWTTLARAAGIEPE